MRKRRPTRAGFGDRRKIHRIATITRYASTKPTIGDTTIGTATLSTTLVQLTFDAEASPAPTTPPISACEDDEGSPKYQVIRFQVIAPSTPAASTVSPCSPLGGVITSLTVLATWTPSSAPSMFITAAISSATRGVSARVDTAVAIALAASWNPLV